MISITILDFKKSIFFSEDMAKLKKWFKVTYLNESIRDIS